MDKLPDRPQTFSDAHTLTPAGKHSGEQNRNRELENAFDPQEAHSREVMTRELSILVVAAAGALLLSHCDDGADHEAERVAKQARAEELALMRDMSRAGVEIERRLRERIQANGYVVIIKERGNRELHGISMTTPWTVDCGVGLSVTFASAGDRDGLEVAISDQTFFDGEDYKRLIPIVAAKLADILSGK
jgi:hypothetical protein